MVLNGDVDPTKVLEYACEDQYHDYRVSEENHRKRPGLPRPGFENVSEKLVRQYDCLVRTAIQASRWIAPEMREDVLERFLTGDKDAAGIILLPLLTKLRAVEPPIKGGLCAELFRQVAHELLKANMIEADRADDLSPSEQASSTALPFSELLIFYVRPDRRVRCNLTFTLQEMRPFMSIQSLRRIVLNGVRDWEFESLTRTIPNAPKGSMTWETIPWRTDMVPISCPEIYLGQSSVFRDVIMKFADHIAGPCKLMQWYSMDVWDMPSGGDGGEASWDHLRVDVDESGKRRAWTSLECDGGAVVRRNPWVSWLYHGKMANWELLDEPFCGEDGDSDNFDFYSP
jgi:hypothetical protein